MSEAKAFKEAMRRVPTGVSVVTSFKDGEPRGITVNAYASVSADPPTLLICINRAARSYLYIAESKNFCLNVLAGNQRHLAENFAGKVRERQFDGIEYDVTESGVPVLRGTIAHFDCRVTEEHHAASHSIFIARVVACSARPGSPLGYFNGGYHDFGIEAE